MSTSRRSWVASLLVALAFLSACSTPVRINGAEVDPTVPFLSVVERAWQEKRADDERAQLAAETGCWLLREPKTGTLQPRAFCGPIRHLKDHGKPGVFDEMEFEPRLIGDRQVTVDPDDIDAGDTGLEVPPGIELYRPDGRKPVPADQVPAPPIPKHDSGAIVRLGSTVPNGKAPEDAVIVAPGFTFTLNQYGLMQNIPASKDLDEPRAPADNEEFLAFTVIRQNDPDFRRGKANTSTRYSLRTGGNTVSLEEHLGYATGDFAVSEEPVTLAASVPVGAEVELVVGVGGVDQTISLRTGERTSTTAAAYYRGKTAFGVNRQYAPKPFTRGDFQLQHGITFTAASVSPFDPDRGWALEGQMWFYLGWDGRISQRVGDDQTRYREPEYDTGRSITLSRPDEKRIEILEGSPVVKITYDRAGMIIAQIPDSTDSISVSYAPQGQFRVSPFATDSDVAPKSGPFKFDAESFTIDL